MEIRKKWSDFFEKNGISCEQRELYLAYIDSLLANNVPIIFEFNHLAKLLGITSLELARIATSTEKFYRTFSLLKRKGGSRIIATPYPVLAHCQEWIFHNILEKIEISKDAYAFCKGRNILDNATIHLGSKEILKMDILDFFGSIRLGRIIKIFKDLGYSNLLSFQLASLCSLNNALPQGACTSPLISNLASINMDKRLRGLAGALDLKYSRYADDITFSGDSIPKKLFKFIKTILETEGFLANENKTMLKKANQKKVVTGICITGDRARIPKPYRRNFRMEFHWLLKHGKSAFDGTKGNFDPLYIDRMLGKVNFILSVEPESIFFKKAFDQLVEMKKKLSIVVSCSKNPKSS